ncbi:MAG: glycosyltransferase [Gemmatimonadota bacterium]
MLVPVSERPESLTTLYQEFSAPLRETGRSFEFLFIAPTQYRALTAPLAELARKGEPVRVLNVGPGVGETAMLKLGVQRSSGSILLTLPAYARVTPAALPDLLAALEQGADLVIARRWPRNDPWINRLQSQLFHRVLRGTMGGRLHDIASGVRGTRREVFEAIPLYGDFFRFLPLLAIREGYVVEEIPTPQHANDTHARVYGPGVYARRIVDLLGLAFLLRFTDKPLRFFGLIGAILSAFGGVLLLTLFIERLGGEGIAGRPLLLLSILLVTVGLQSIALGLVGEMIVHLNAGRRRIYRFRGTAPGTGPVADRRLQPASAALAHHPALERRRISDRRQVVRT